MRFRPAVVSASVLVLLGAGAALVRSQGRVDGALLFEDVRRRVLGAGLDSSLTTDEAWVRAARGLVANLDDPYAGLYSPEELASFSRNTLRNDYGGLGMLIQDQLGASVVGVVYPRTPAAAAGVQAGDRIVAIDDSTTRGQSLSDVTGRLIGPPGTPVTVTFTRPGVTEPIRMHLVRAIVHVPAVPYTLVFDGGVGYIPLQRFNDASAAEVRGAIEQLRARGAHGYVLDLRGNPGGSLEESIGVSGLFLRPDQSVVTVRFRGQPVEIGRTSGTPALPDAPLVVLLDGNTASAAEIVAGALQDHDRALVLGTTSYGKGVVQSVFPLRQGWALKLTTAGWFTPSGRSIQRPRSGGDNDAPPDSLETDAARSGRPVFHSDAGRVVYGGGGITPDVFVPADTLTSPELRFLRALAPKSQVTFVALNDYALELRSGVRADFAVRPAWRTAWRERLTRAGVEVPVQFDSAQRLVNRLLEQRVSSFAFGDSAAFRRAARDDSQLLRALTLLKDGTTQAALFAQAARDRG